MPTSYAESIPTVIKVMQDVAPKTVLDIGIGNGKYGLLLKEYCGIDTIVDGVEAWEPYLTDIHRSIYREIFIEDVAKMDLGRLSRYDLYLMIDIIEHVPKATGHRILKELDGLVLISTPIEDYRAHYDNHFEDHVSHWTSDDFAQYAYQDFSTELSTVVLINSSKRRSPKNEDTKLKDELQSVYASNSWRLTKGLRSISGAIKGAKKK